MESWPAPRIRRARAGVVEPSRRCQPGLTKLAPLSSDYRTEPWWWDDPAAGGGESTAATEAAGRPAVLPARADVVVVGAGYTGLAAARALAAGGRQVLVVDRDLPGHGASGRNGGMAHAGVKHHAHTLLAGPDGRAMWDESVAAFEALAGLVAGLDPDPLFRPCGHLELAGHPRHVTALQRAAVAQRSLGEQTRLVTGDELAQEIGSSAFSAGLLVERSASVHPARLARGLLAAATGSGAEVHHGVAVAALTPEGGGCRVETDSGSVQADQVVLSTGSTTGSLVPWLDRRVLSVGSFIIATEELAPDLARSVSPRGRVFFDTRNFLNYWRLSPDGRRVLFGGRTSFAPTTAERARDLLYRAMLRVHPQLAGVRVARAWGGLVDLTADRTPHVGRDPRTGVVFALGYSGTGVALSVHLGTLIGRYLAGAATDQPALEDWSAFATQSFPRVPAAARWPGLLAVAGLWYRARDATGR